MIYLSPGFDEIWGRPCAGLEASPQSWPQSVLPEDRERVAAAGKAREAASDWDEIYRIVRPDGAVRWIRDRGYPVPEPGGRVRRVVGVAEDITERKQWEEQFLHAQRMEAIGTLASGVAHDLNNILAPILMVAGLLKLRSAASAKDREMLTMIEHCGQRGADVIRQLLTFGRSKTGEPGIVDSVPSDLWTVRADPTQLHQVLMNLCVNARDAMPTGGLLTVEAANVEGAAADPDLKAPRQVRLTVQDTGHGIPPAVRERIFDPFFTTKEAGKGTGLGLSTVADIARKHGGVVKVASEPGRGTVFAVYLPAAAEPADEAPAARAAPVTLGRGELVLVVDDEPPIRALLSDLLEGEGYRVLTAGSGEDALKVYFQHQETLRLVVTDFMMPGMDGLALIRALRVLAPGLPIVATSGMEHNEEQAELTALGIAAILMKPFVPAQIVDAVRRHLAAKRAPGGG
ncbi:MAG: response regulator [Opitutae bacterium]|nr:response regulator [Opitutae bacterium]